MTWFVAIRWLLALWLVGLAALCSTHPLHAAAGVGS